MRIQYPENIQKLWREVKPYLDDCGNLKPETPEYIIKKNKKLVRLRWAYREKLMNE